MCWILADPTVYSLTLVVAEMKSAAVRGKSKSVPLHSDPLHTAGGQDAWETARGSTPVVPVPGGKWPGLLRVCGHNMK